MTCEWWEQDEDSKHGGYCTLWDDNRGCSGTKDNDCYGITIEEYERQLKSEDVRTEIR